MAELVKKFKKYQGKLEEYFGGALDEEAGE